ncbi:MAG: DUF4418 family protein [Candidatus Thorarchaeota archaeon]
MKMDIILYLIIAILGIVTAIAPWTFAPVCMTEMRCWFTRDVMTVLGATISVVALLGLYKSSE